jgi:hypothetical protein
MAVLKLADLSFHNRPMENHFHQQTLASIRRRNGFVGILAAVIPYLLGELLLPQILSQIID